MTMHFTNDAEPCVYAEQMQSDGIEFEGQLISALTVFHLFLENVNIAPVMLITKL